MLRNFRQVFKGNQMPMTVVMGVVLVGLVAYLAPSSGNPEAPDNVMARVYGRDVLKRDTDRLISSMVEQMGRRANLEQMLPFLQQRALDELVGQKLREELAERHGILVTDAEVRQALEARLRKYPVFVTPEGQLRETSEINAILRENGQSVIQWEEASRADLTLRKLVDQEAAKVPVDEAWVAVENRVRNEKLSLESFTVKPDPSTVADPGDGKLAVFLKEGGARFQVPPRRVIQYVTLDEAFFGSSLTMDEAALKAAYESKKTQYTELKASHILFKAKTEAEYAAALKKAEELRPKLAGKDFNKVADEVSEDDTIKGDHGDLGWFKASTMSPAIFTGANALASVGEISAPVRSEKGVHLIKLEGRRSKSFDEVKEELRSQLSGERFATKAKERLEQLRKRTGERGDLSGAARNLGLKVQTSQPLLNEDSVTIPGLQDAAYVASEAFRLKVGQVSRIMRTGGAFTVIRVQEERPIAVPPLAEIRDRVLNAWKLEEARKAAAEKVKAALQAGDLKSLGEPKNQENTTITALAELGAHPGIRKALLDTPEGKFTPVLWNPEGQAWVARIKNRTPAAPLNFETRQSLVRDLQRAAGERLLLSELQDLESKGRLRPGFSSLYGRFGGIWINTDTRTSKDDLPDAGDL
jgi:peptidyl-prolyl cis-trans isomerase D